MKKSRNADPVISQIELALDLGRFISYKQSWDFVHDLEDTKSKIDELMEKGEADRAVRLYEMFLSGCYEKAEEIDDSGGNLGIFIQDLFLSWIKARQQAGHAAQETVGHIFNWMENDDYGFCYDIEKEVAQVLNKTGFLLFRKHFQDQFKEAFSPFESKEPKYIYDYPSDVYRNASILKDIYIVKKDVKAYLVLCEKVGTTPKDCEHIASLQKAKRHYDDALAWAEKGLKLEREREWGNQSSYALTGIRQELFNKLGRREDALESAWDEFRKYPSMYAYDQLRKYVPKKDFEHWHEKAIQEARRTLLSAFIEICTETKEWDVLSEHIVAIEHEKLEKISHYTTEKAAKGLARKHGQAAAKVYGALGMRIVKSGKSKYYQYTLEHFRNAKRLYERSGCEQMWSALVERVRKDHSRKYSFIGYFEEIVSGRAPESPESFEKRVRKRWIKQTLK